MYPAGLHNFGSMRYLKLPGAVNLIGGRDACEKVEGKKIFLGYVVRALRAMKNGGKNITGDGCPC